MSTIIYPSPIFGPVRSRRLGVSLGINLLPGDGKWCTFDCVYCECGFNGDHRPKEPLPTRLEVSKRLEEKLLEMREEGIVPDVLTFAGNGEPTMHPEFALIVDDVCTLRDRLCPEAKISVLSNSTRAVLPEVREALLRTDNPIMKLDTVDSSYIQRIDRPTGRYDVATVMEALRVMSPKLIVQTMFMDGELDGESVCNTGEEYVEPWLEAVRQIAPRQVMVYTIARETPAQGLQKTPADVLDRIGRRVEAMGIPCSVSY